MLQVEKTAERTFRLRGVIDENADLAPLPDVALELDLSGVERINSMGILVWQRWRRARKQGVTLRDVPVSFVLALACVEGLAEGMRIRSVCAPFVDRETGATEDLVLAADALARIRDTGECPPVPSPTTSRPLVLDDDPRQYFAFLGAARGPTLAQGS